LISAGILQKLGVWNREEAMLLTAFFLAALVQDQVDNPEYKGWAAFKPGSTVSFKYVKEGSVQDSLQRTTLKSIDEKEAVLSTEFSMNGKVLGQATERKVPAKAPSAQAPANVKEGEEEIEAGGKKLKCRTKEFEKKLSTGKTGTVKIWVNEEVPGMAAKIETTGEGGSKFTMIASEWVKK
jgi:hypothetical protein